MKLRLSAVVSWILLTVSGFAVSYTINVPPGVSLIANQLDHPPNDLSTVLGASLPAGSKIFKWDCNNFHTYTYAFGLWTAGGTLAPGEGAIVKNSGSVPAPVTFTGT